MGLALILPQEDFSGYERSKQVHPVEKQAPTAIKIMSKSELNNAKDQIKCSAAFTPLMTSYRDVKWEITSGDTYAKIDKKSGLLTAKYTGDTTAHDVTVKVSSVAFPAVSDTKVISVVCNFVPNPADVVTFQFNLARPQKGEKLILTGFINGEESPMVTFDAPVVGDTTASKPSALDGITLVDNGDGTATVEITTDEYNHQVSFTARHAVYPTSISQTKKININDFVIIDAADGQNSVDLMEVFYGNGKAAASDKMWQSEAYIVTSL